MHGLYKGRYMNDSNILSGADTYHVKVVISQSQTD